MGERIGILHLSDIHANSKAIAKIDRLSSQLLEDIDRVQSQHETIIQAVCISGDLINSGAEYKDSIQIVVDKIIQPLKEKLHLDDSRFFIVPGNHEVDRNKIIKHIEVGLCSTLITEESIDDFLNQIDSTSIDRIDYFNDFALRFSGQPVLNTPLMRSYICELDNLTLGVVCINSAWRSTGIGKDEKGKMVVGRRLIIDGFDSIETADVKICLMHHPLDWLVDSDKIAIEKCISKYDVVLNGHIHESDTKVYTSFNGHSIYNTCGKFDSSSDIYNGYTVISINPYNKDFNFILRQYFPDPRDCFDKAVGLIDEGIFSINMSKKNDTLALAYNVTNSIKKGFLEFANSYFVSNVISGEVIKSFDESFITPTFSKHSEYEKETRFDNGDEDESPTMDSICNGHNNILMLGKKEIGKTTALHYIAKYLMTNFNVLHYVPIVIDCSYIDFAGKDVILRASHNFVTDYCQDDEAYSKSEIRSLLEDGRCTIIFDNFEDVNTDELKKINGFLTTYPNNRFIFSELETIGARALSSAHVIPTCKYDKIHICSLSKSQIRAVTQRAITRDTPEAASLVDKILLCFKKTTLPKNPFVLSLILSLCNDTEFAPINEAVVMEQFMEVLLGKALPTEAASSSYDFRVKEDFLIYIVSYMHENNRYYLQPLEFEKLLAEYHEYRGFVISDTHFDILFFKQGILVKFSNSITFRYACMIEYYLAKKAEHEPKFLQYILSNHNYLNYHNEITYYTGLNRENIDILRTIRRDLSYYFDSLAPFFDELNDYFIGLDFALPEDSFPQRLVESRLTQEKSDDLSDIEDKSEKVLPETINKNTAYNNMESFITALLIYGTCIKNSELISRDEKTEAYEVYLTGLCVMLAILQHQTADTLNRVLSEIEKDDENAIAKLKEFTSDTLKIAIPIAIQNIALENIGTSKLRPIIEKMIQDNQLDDFQRFFSVFIFSDLRLKGLQNVLKKYISSVDNKSILKIIFFKLWYYYDLRYFSTSLDPFLENTLADINAKLQNGSKFTKSVFLKKIKKKDRYVAN